MNAPREWAYAAHPTRSLSEAPMRRTCSSRTESKDIKTGPVPCPPLFIAPEDGDYRVSPGSPALELGFENFDMDKFGLLPDFPRKCE